MKFTKMILMAGLAAAGAMLVMAADVRATFPAQVWKADNGTTVATLDQSGNLTLAGSVTAAGISGSLSNNAATATYVLRPVLTNKVEYANVENKRFEILAAGMATMDAGGCVVSNAAVNATNLMWLTYQSRGGSLAAVGVTNIIDGEAFNIFSGDAGDTNYVWWMIVKP